MFIKVLGISQRFLPPIMIKYDGYLMAHKLFMGTEMRKQGIYTIKEHSEHIISFLSSIFQDLAVMKIGASYHIVYSLNIVFYVLLSFFLYSPDSNL